MMTVVNPIFNLEMLRETLIRSQIRIFEIGDFSARIIIDFFSEFEIS